MSSRRGAATPHLQSFQLLYAQLGESGAPKVDPERQARKHVLERHGVDVGRGHPHLAAPPPKACHDRAAQQHWPPRQCIVYGHLLTPTAGRFRCLML